MKSIRRINDSNVLYVTDSVFNYTVSHLVGHKDQKNNSGIAAIISYIQENIGESELSLRTVAKMFYYSEKYFSSLFVKSTGVRFTDYLNGLRVDYATKLIEEGVRSVSELSSRCGFDNSYYFSKVFKKIKGVSPSVLMKRA
jgi:two-component system response regulator YesN